MKLTLTARETANILRQRQSKGRQRLSGPKLERRPKATFGRERDVGFLIWLHEDLPCIACCLLGETNTPIEAAHQKIQAASRGVHKRLGVRPSDMWCVPLCRSHHREGPLCCDPAQTKFWLIVGLEPEQVADFCMDLYRAYEQERDGSVIVRDFASLAAGQRAAA